MPQNSKSDNKIIVKINFFLKMKPPIENLISQVKPFFANFLFRQPQVGFKMRSRKSWIVCGVLATSPVISGPSPILYGGEESDSIKSISWTHRPWPSESDPKPDRDFSCQHWAPADCQGIKLATICLEKESLILGSFYDFRKESGLSNRIIIYRPGVAGAVLQTASPYLYSFIQSVSQSALSSKSKYQ